MVYRGDVMPGLRWGIREVVFRSLAATAGPVPEVTGLAAPEASGDLAEMVVPDNVERAFASKEPGESCRDAVAAVGVLTDEVVAREVRLSSRNAEEEEEDDEEDEEESESLSALDCR